MMSCLLTQGVETPTEQLKTGAQKFKQERKPAARRVFRPTDVGLASEAPLHD
jgi:hypothetical protein